MSDDLADYPIVILENDFPEAIGKIGLFDFLMPVEDSGLVFTAAVPGRLYEYGPEFTAFVQKYSRLRAASTLVQMGWARGESFTFLRAALELSISDVANIYGVTDIVVMEWESNLVPIPITVWNCFSFRVCLADSRQLPNPIQYYRGNLPARLIRVFPNLPMQGQVQVVDSYPPGNNPCPLPPFPQADCLPSRCK